MELMLGVLIALGLLGLAAWELERVVWHSACRALPPLSETERMALEIGTVGFEKELFSGRPNWSAWQRLPAPTLTPEEQAFLDGPVSEACRMADDWAITHTLADLPPALWEHLKAERFFGLVIPRDYGGHGFSAQAHSAVLQKLASVSGTLASTVAVPNSLGPAELLLHYGTEAQKAHYLPRLARGEEVPCFALTGPQAGSDATAVPDRGVVVKEEIDGVPTLGLRLTLDKRYITLAPVATLIGVAFRLYDPDHWLGPEEDRGLTLALVPRNTPGLEIGRRHLPLNVPFQNGPIRAHEVFVPLDALLGGVEQVGQGWRMLVECLSIGRGISLPANAAGAARMLAVTTGAYARLRRQFGLAVGQFEGVGLLLGRLTARAYATMALAESLAAAVDRGEKPAVSSAIAKYHTTEWGRQVIQDAMDIHGGKGIILGPRNYLGRSWQGAAIPITVEGANVMTRNLMIFGQGAIRCHPYVQAEMAALAQATPGARRTFWKLGLRHAGHALGIAGRAWAMAWWHGSWPAHGRHAKGPVAHHYHRLDRYAAALAWASEVSLWALGGQLKRREAVSARLGDLLSGLYAASAVLRAHESAGAPREERDLVQWWMDHTAQQLEQSLFEIVHQFPRRGWGRFLEFWLLPWGRQEKGPTDALTLKVAEAMMNPGALRARLWAGLHQEEGPHHPAAAVNAALPLALELEELEHRWRQAVRERQLTLGPPEYWPAAAVKAGIWSAFEGARWESGQARVAELMAVDDWDPADLPAGRSLAS